MATNSVTMSTKEAKHCCEAEATFVEVGEEADDDDDDDEDGDEDDDDGDDAGEEEGPFPFTVVIFTFMPWPQ